MIINHGKDILDEHYRKNHLKGAEYRLLAMFLAWAFIITAFVWLGVQFASASDAFIPH